MPDQTDVVPTEAVERRRFMRGGALLAGAAAGAVAISAASARPASAANGDAVTVGGNLSGTATTTLTVNAATVPTLSLRNSSGPTLSLQPLAAFTGTLRIGEIVNTADGPYIGIDDGTGSGAVAILATGSDLAAIPVPQPLPSPVRLIDTRPGSSRDNLLASSPSAFDSSGRLKAGKFMDIAVDPADGDFTDTAAFLNLTSTGSLANGFLLAYPPVDNRPNSSTLNFTKGATVANGAFVGVGVVSGAFAVRIYTNADSHVILDLTGTVTTAVPGPAATAKAQSRALRLRASRRVQRTYGRR